MLIEKKGKTKTRYELQENMWFCKECNKFIPNCCTVDTDEKQYIHCGECNSRITELTASLKRRRADNKVSKLELVDLSGYSLAIAKNDNEDDNYASLLACHAYLRDVMKNAVSKTPKQILYVPRYKGKEQHNTREEVAKENLKNTKQHFNDWIKLFETTPLIGLWCAACEDGPDVNKAKSGIIKTLKERIYDAEKKFEELKKGKFEGVEQARRLEPRV